MKYLDLSLKKEKNEWLKTNNKKEIKRVNLLHINLEHSKNSQFAFISIYSFNFIIVISVRSLTYSVANKPNST
jgi:hypothetical protein